MRVFMCNCCMQTVDNLFHISNDRSCDRISYSARVCQDCLPKCDDVPQEGTKCDSCGTVYWCESGAENEIRWWVAQGHFWGGSGDGGMDRSICKECVKV